MDSGDAAGGIPWRTNHPSPSAESRAVAVSKELEGIGVEHTLELFDAGHMSIGYRYPRSLAFLATALAE